MARAVGSWQRMQLYFLFYSHTVQTDIYIIINIMIIIIVQKIQVFDSVYLYITLSEYWSVKCEMQCDVIYLPHSMES